MSPTFNPEWSSVSDWVLVEKLSYKWLYEYQRGDVAVLLYVPLPCSCSSDRRMHAWNVALSQADSCMFEATEHLLMRQGRVPHMHAVPRIIRTSS